MRQYVRAIWWFLFLVITSACEQTPESARKELGHLGVAFSPEGFITSLTNNDPVAVRLFLKARMDPNTTAAQGIPALLIGTMNCDGKLRDDKKTHGDIAKALIAHEANVNVTHELHPPLSRLAVVRPPYHQPRSAVYNCPSCTSAVPHNGHANGSQTLRTGIASFTGVSKTPSLVTTSPNEAAVRSR